MEWGEGQGGFENDSAERRDRVSRSDYTPLNGRTRAGKSWVCLSISARSSLNRVNCAQSRNAHKGSPQSEN